VVQEIQVSRYPVVGQPVTVRVRFANQGEGSSSWCFGNVYVDPLQPPQGPTDVSDYHFIVPDLPPGRSWLSNPVSVVFNWPGERQLYAQVDTYYTGGRIAESDETNNVFGPQSQTVYGGVIYLPQVHANHR